MRHLGAMQLPFCTALNIVLGGHDAYVYVSEAGHKRKSDLERWVHQGVEFVQALPPENPKRKKSVSQGVENERPLCFDVHHA